MSDMEENYRKRQMLGESLQKFKKDIEDVSNEILIYLNGVSFLKNRLALKNSLKFYSNLNSLGGSIIIDIKDKKSLDYFEMKFYPIISSEKYYIEFIIASFDVEVYHYKKIMVNVGDMGYTKKDLEKAKKQIFNEIYLFINLSGENKKIPFLKVDFRKKIEAIVKSIMGDLNNKRPIKNSFYFREPTFWFVIETRYGEKLDGGGYDLSGDNISIWVLPIVKELNRNPWGVRLRLFDHKKNLDFDEYKEVGDTYNDKSLKDIKNWILTEVRSKLKI